MSNQTARQPPAYLWIRRPRCPDCGSAKLKVQRSVDNGDGSRTRYCKCGCCGLNVVLIVE